MKSKKEKNEFDHVVKLILIGDPSVGKTCLVHRFCTNEYLNPSYISIGVDLEIKAMKIDEDNYKILIYDTPGIEREGVRKILFPKMMGAILAFSVTERESFNSVERWMKHIRMYSNEAICIILVGNKADNDMEREVSKEEGQALADSLGIKFFETSALTGLNATEAFIQCARAIKIKIFSKLPSDSFPQMVKLSNISANNSESKKC